MTTNLQRVEAWHAEWLMAPGAHWGDSIAWGTAEEIARRLDLESVAEAPIEDCDQAPEGCYCAEARGHEGACRVYPLADIGY